MRSITSFKGRFLALIIMPPEIDGSRSMSIFARRPSSIRISLRGTSWAVVEKEIILSPPRTGGGGEIIRFEIWGILTSALFVNFLIRFFYQILI